MSDVVKTTCPYCGVGCGVEVSRVDGGYQVRGDKLHPANFGKLCSKGSALAETLSDDDRLLNPLVAGQAVSWDEALETVARQFASVIEKSGPDAVAFYVSGQLLTEDYYVANKLMKGFIGSGNIDTNSRLCMSSSVAGHKRAFGSDTVPGCYEDFEIADLVILTGSNLAWCHPVLYQRLVRVKRQRPELRVVVIDPRKTPTCDIADLHLSLANGTDAVLFNGLLSWLNDQGHADPDYVRDHTQGFDETLRLARWYAPSITAVAEHCDLSVDDVTTLFHWFAGTQKVVTVYSQGVNQTSSGTDKVNTIINCHLLTGRIGKPGMGPFSVTGQPNAMGGREVGALANQLTAHMDFEDPAAVDLVGRFWSAPHMATSAGLKAVDMFRAVDEGRIKALWIMATNPAVSLPDSNFIAKALEKCEFLVVSDVVNTDTTRYADVLLPATTWGEKQGTVTNSERRISRQRPFREAPGAARADWWILAQLAKKMGFQGFGWQSPAEIFSEFAALSGFENQGERDFDISALQGLSEKDYEQMLPVQWPVRKTGESTERLFADGRFYTPSGKANFIPVTPRPPGMLTSAAYPLILNTGRVRDQWHTMTRTGKSPRLTGHVPEPYAELHEKDARQYGIAEGSLVQISSRWGEVIVRARISETQRAGNVFVPMHWSDRFASAAKAGALVNPVVDPVSGQPEFKHTPVQISAYEPAWHGFVLSRHEITPVRATYWSRAKRDQVWHYELAGEEPVSDWAGCARDVLCVPEQAGQANWSELLDIADSRYHAARYIDGCLEAVIFIGPDFDLPPRDWLLQLFAKEQLSHQERNRVLAATPGPGEVDVGKIVCSCFSVGYNQLITAIREQNLSTPEAIGDVLEAGTNCGSCVPELRSLIATVLGKGQA